MRFRHRLWVFITVGVAALLGPTVACTPTASPAQRMADEYWEKIRRAPDPTSWEIFRALNERAAKENGDHENARGVELAIRFIEAGSAQAAARTDVQLATQMLVVIQYIRERDRVPAYEAKVPGFAKRIADAEAQIAPVLR